MSREQDITWWLFTSICSANIMSPLKLLPVVKSNAVRAQMNVLRPEPGCYTFNFIHFETHEPILINVKANISVSLRSDGRTLVLFNKR